MNLFVISKKLVVSQIVCTLLIGLIVAKGQPAENGNLTPTAIGRIIVNAPFVQESALSPDGLAVAYTVVTYSEEKNSTTQELFLQKLSEGGELLGNAKSISQFSAPGFSGFIPTWQPDGKALLLQGVENGKRSLVRYDVGSGSVSSAEGASLKIRDAATPVQTIGAGKGKPRPRITEVQSRYIPSPDGRFVAFSATLVEQAPQLDPRKGVVQGSRNDSLWISGLFVLEIGTGTLRQLTPETMSVSASDGISWSPDGSKLVFTDSFNRYGRTGMGANSVIRIVDVESGAIRDLITQSGRNTCPSWSPDGKWVAFGADFRPIAYNPAWHALVSVETGEISRVSGGGYSCTVSWTPDSRSFYGPDFRVDVATKRSTQLSKQRTSHQSATKFSKDLRRRAFIRSSFDEPGDVYVQDLPNGTPKRITFVGDSFPFRGKVRTDWINWKSKDGAEISGYLVTPRSAWDTNGTRISKPLPTIAYNPGGPSPVFAQFGFAAGQHGISPALALQGYAVLVADVRARYSNSSTTNAELYYRLAFEDMMSGLDELVRRGVADPKRLGAGGHSYGANLMSYVITHTDKLRAAQLHDPTRLSAIESVSPLVGTWNDAGIPLLYGVSDPFSPEGKRIIADFPQYHLDKIRTPTLIQAAGRGRDSGYELYKAMVRLGVPRELVGYQYGHAAETPAPMVDNIVRVLDWFDYWLRDIPYPDKERQKEYDTWKAAHPMSNQNNSAGRPTSAGKSVKNGKRP